MAFGYFPILSPTDLAGNKEPLWSNGQDFCWVLKMFWCFLFLTFLEGNRIIAFPKVNRCYTEVASLESPLLFTGSLWYRAFPFAKPLLFSLFGTEHLCLRSLPPVGLVKYYIPYFQSSPKLGLKICRCLYRCLEL